MRTEIRHGRNGTQVRRTLNGAPAPEAPPRLTMRAVETHTASTLADLLDELEEQYGAPIGKRPEVKAARAAYNRLGEVGAALGDVASDERREARRAVIAGDLAAGTITTAEAVTRASALDLGAGTQSSVRRMLDSARHRLAAEMAEHLRSMGDSWVTDVLRPLVDQRVREVMAAIADPSGIGPHDNDLRRLHEIADALRELRIIPATGRRVDAWRWAERRDDLSLAETFCSFVWRQHNGHGAGIYTEAEVEATEGEG